MKAAAVCLVLWACGAGAGALETCLAPCASEDCDMACFGLTADACSQSMSASERDTTIGISQCQVAEFDAWDGALNALWPGLRSYAAEQDIENTLVDAQRAWIVFRDAECRFQTARWGMGTFRQIAWPACRGHLTAERVTALRAVRREPN